MEIGFFEKTDAMFSADRTFVGLDQFEHILFGLSRDSAKFVVVLLRSTHVVQMKVPIADVPKEKHLHVLDRSQDLFHFANERRQTTDRKGDIIFSNVPFLSDGFADVLSETP